MSENFNYSELRVKAFALERDVNVLFAQCPACKSCLFIKRLDTLTARLVFDRVNVILRKTKRIEHNAKK